MRTEMSNPIRDKLVLVASEWQKRYGIAPQITKPISELDAAVLVGFPHEAYSRFMQDKTAVRKGSDFVYEGTRYQVKGNRPSGKPGSKITMVPKATNYDWDILIWIRYNEIYEV